MEELYPKTLVNGSPPLSPEELRIICYSAFPDSMSATIGDYSFAFRFRGTEASPFLYARACIGCFARIVHPHATYVVTAPPQIRSELLQAAPGRVKEEGAPPPPLNRQQQNLILRHRATTKKA